MTRINRKLVAGAVAALAVGGGGAAVAATQAGSPQQESQAVIADAAQQLGVSSSKLSSAIEKALENRVDAAVAAGQLTKAQGDALKAQIAAGQIPLVAGPGPRGGPGVGPGLDSAASYLGLTRAELRTQLEADKTLAQIASANGKSADGLVAAMVADATARLDAAVSAGRLTKAQEQTILADVQQRITEMVNNGRPAGGLTAGGVPA